MQGNKVNIVFALGTTVLFILFFFGGDVDTDSTRSLKHFWNTGHIFFFAPATYLLLHYSSSLRQKPFRSQFFWILFVALFVGISIELIQTGLGRQFSLEDLRKDITGSFVGLFFFSASRKFIGITKLKVLQSLVLVLLILEILPLATALLDEWKARRSFPVLANFETPQEATRWVGSAEFEIVQDKNSANNHNFEVKFGTTKYSGVFLKFFPRNWEGYNSLQFTAVNPSSAELQITCRIHDMQHNDFYNDRFNERYVLKPGKTTFSIPMEDILNAPATRRMDIKQISEVGFFVARQQSENIIYLDDIMLL